jgi:hypothetical protein
MPCEESIIQKIRINNFLYYLRLHFCFVRAKQLKVNMPQFFWFSELGCLKITNREETRLLPQTLINFWIGTYPNPPIWRILHEFSLRKRWHGNQNVVDDVADGGEVRGGESVADVSSSSQTCSKEGHMNCVIGVSL